MSLMKPILFRAAEKNIADEHSTQDPICASCNTGMCNMILHVSQCKNLPSSPVLSCSSSASLVMGRIAVGGDNSKLVVLQPSEYFDLSTPIAVYRAIANAPCVNKQNKRKASTFGPLLGDHMVPRRSYAEYVVKEFEWVEIPKQLLEATHPDSWWMLADEEKRDLEDECIAWIMSRISEAKPIRSSM